MHEVVDAAFQVHKARGPGLLESVYETCLEYEFQQRGIRFERQRSMPITYGSVRIEAGLRLDFLVDDQVVVELKAVEMVLPVHKAQVLSYLRLAGKRIALLINFNVPLIRDGIKRFVL